MKYKKVWVKKDMNKEERAIENELRREAKEKNEARTETEEKVQLQGSRCKIEEVVLKRGSATRNMALKVVYTNIDGILSSRLELRNFWKEEKPDIVGIVETKLASERRT